MTSIASDGTAPENFAITTSGMPRSTLASPGVTFTSVGPPCPCRATRVVRTPA